MKVTPIREVIAAQPVFRELDPADLDLLAACGRNAVVPAGTLLAREGLAVVLTLDPVRLLGRAELGGDSTNHVPRYGADIPHEQADARLRELVEWFLKDLRAKLPQDIPGASLEVRTRGAG